MENRKELRKVRTLKQNLPFLREGTDSFFVTWNDLNKGAIKEVNLSNNRITTLSQEKRNLQKSLLFSGWVPNSLQEGTGQPWTRAVPLPKIPGIYLMDRESREPKKLVENGDFPVFTKEGKRVFFSDRRKVLRKPDQKPEIRRP